MIEGFNFNEKLRVLSDKANYLTLRSLFSGTCSWQLDARWFNLSVTKSKQTIHIKTSYYFPKAVRAIGAVFGLFGLAMIWTSPVLGLLFIFITVVIFTTHYGFEIMVQPNSVREYISVLGFKEGRRSPYNSIEFIFIQPGQLRYLSYTLSEKVSDGFEAFLKFEGRNEMLVLALLRKETLVQSMKSVATRLQVPIRDYTDANPIIIFEP